jgi:hypothetical protein
MYLSLAANAVASYLSSHLLRRGDERNEVFGKAPIVDLCSNVQPLDDAPYRLDRVRRPVERAACVRSMNGEIYGYVCRLASQDSGLPLHSDGANGRGSLLLNC